LLVLFEREI
jgi:hypothetical protein